MYIPAHFETTDLKLMSSFIEEYSFGTLITNADNEISANHYPFLIEHADEITLWTHVAKNNPQWKTFKETNDCLLIFNGPHAYISPVYYENELNVPTWNYTAVHLNCEAEVVEDLSEQKRLMKNLVANFETKNQTDWKYELPEDFHLKMFNAIVWLKFKVKKIDGKFKLSQNRDKADYQKVLAEFSTRQSENDQELFKYMKLTMPEKMK
jgi:transcriptional regulator